MRTRPTLDPPLPHPIPAIAPEDLRSLIPAWLRSLRAERKAMRTLEAYAASVLALATYLEQTSLPTTPQDLQREHLEAFMVALLERGTAATAASRYRGCQAFFRWCVEEAVIAISPMDRMRPPKVVEQPVPVLPASTVAALLDAIEGDRDFEALRDAAIIRLFYATGLRLAELAGLRYLPGDPVRSDVDLDLGTVRVIGKGGRIRVVHMGARTTRAIDRYLRLRRMHPCAHEPWLWLGERGHFTASGIGQMVARRGRAIGIRIHPHQFRHSWAHAAQVKGMSLTDLRIAGGWRSLAMLERYAASAATERSLIAQQRLSPGDDV